MAKVQLESKYLSSFKQKKKNYFLIQIYVKLNDKVHYQNVSVCYSI